jgi:hypothetical protein
VTDPSVTARLLTDPALTSDKTAPRARGCKVPASTISRDMSRELPCGTERLMFRLPAPREEVAMDPLVPVIVVMLGPEIV